MTWYVAKEGQTYGPFSESELKQARAAGRFAANDLIWRDGLSDWVSLSSQLDQSSTKPSPRPPPPPPSAFKSTLETSTPDATSRTRAEFTIGIDPVVMASDAKEMPRGPIELPMRASASQMTNQVATNQTETNPNDANQSDARQSGANQSPLPSVVMIEQAAVPKVSAANVILVLFGLVFGASVLAWVLGGGGYSLSRGHSVAEAIQKVTPIKLMVTEFYLSNGQLPQDFSDLAFDPTAYGFAPGSVQLIDGTIVFSVPGFDSAHNKLALEPVAAGDYQLTWRCGHAPLWQGSNSISRQTAPNSTTISHRHLPDDCR